MRYKEIELTQDKWAIIDALDYDLIAPFTWQTIRSYQTWYAVSSRRGLPKLFMHQLISLPPDNLEVDHVDGNGLFNSRSNLRWATRSQNNWARIQPLGVSGYRGVSPNRDKWMAYIRINNERLHLGTYNTREEAARAYDEAAGRYHGRFARLNFSD